MIWASVRQCPPSGALHSAYSVGMASAALGTLVAVDVGFLIAVVFAVLITIAWIVGAVWLVLWTWRKTRGSMARRILGLSGVAALFVVLWAGSRIAP